jgi:hypothetical protein
MIRNNSDLVGRLVELLEKDLEKAKKQSLFYDKERNVEELIFARGVEHQIRRTLWDIREGQESIHNYKMGDS